MPSPVTDRPSRRAVRSHRSTYGVIVRIRSMSACVVPTSSAVRYRPPSRSTKRAYVANQVVRSHRGGVADDHRLAAAQVVSARRVLVCHTAGEAEHVGERFFLGRVRAEAGPAKAGAQDGGVDGNDGTQTGVRVGGQRHLFRAVRGDEFEHWFQRCTNVRLQPCLVTDNLGKWPYRAMARRFSPFVSSWQETDMTAERSRSSHEKDHQMAQTDEFDAPEALLTPSEVAALFRVQPEDGHTLGASGQAHRHPHARRPPALPASPRSVAASRRCPKKRSDPRGGSRAFPARSSGRGGLVRATLRVSCRGLVHSPLQATRRAGRYGVTTTKSIDASHATRPLTVAVPEPRPAVALSRSMRVSSASVSPGPTWARKRALSMPPNSGNLPA